MPDNLVEWILSYAARLQRDKDHEKILDIV